jgi:putative MATE family efflux protein
MGSNENRTKVRLANHKMRLVSLAAPTIAANVLLNLVALIAIGVVDQLGSSAVAAVIAADRVYFATQAVALGLATGTTALVAHAWGAKDSVAADGALKLSLCTGLVLSLLLTAGVHSYAPHLMRLIQMDAATLPMAVRYLRILSYFMPCFTCVAIGSAALRATGDAVTPMLLSMFGNAVTLATTYGLVFGRFGLPRVGLYGAAWAAGIAMLSIALSFLTLWRVKWLRLKPLGNTRYSKSQLSHLIRLSVPASLEQVLFNGALLGFLAVISIYGQSAYTAYGVGVNLLSLSVFIGIGFTAATATMVGQHLGAGEPQEAERAAWHASRWAVAIMTTIALILCLGAKVISRSIISDHQTREYLVALIWILACVQPLMAVEFSLSGAFRGAGDTRAAVRITATGLLVGRVTLTLVFYALDLSVYWIYCALLGDYAIKALMYVTAFRRGRWKTSFAETKTKSAAQGKLQNVTA